MRTNQKRPRVHKSLTVPEELIIFGWHGLIDGRRLFGQHRCSRAEAETTSADGPATPCHCPTDPPRLHSVTYKPWTTGGGRGLATGEVVQEFWRHTGQSTGPPANS
jgi:hypothetical protein